MADPPKPTPDTVVRLLAPYFEERSDEVSTGNFTLNQVKDYLKHQIGLLLDRNPQRLMSILYRIDVAESAVHDAFATAPPGRLAEVLAELVLQRQLQKLETQRKYGGSEELPGPCERFNKK